LNRELYGSHAVINSIKPQLNILHNYFSFDCGFAVKVMNASSSSCATLEENCIPPTPHQPGTLFKFLKGSFEKNKNCRMIISTMLVSLLKWPFLHYDEVNM